MTATMISAMASCAWEVWKASSGEASILDFPVLEGHEKEKVKLSAQNMSRKGLRREG
jgi:hypothetical protein